MTSDEEWIEEFSREVRRIAEAMLAFGQDSADMLEKLLEDPIENEKTIRLFLITYGASVTMSNKRGTNRGNDVVGTGRQVAWSCEDNVCTHNHCTQCGQCQARAGDGHTPWYALDKPACEPKPTSRKDRQDE